MFLIVDEQKRVFSHYILSNESLMETWDSKENISKNFKIVVSIYPSEERTQISIKNILAYRREMGYGNLNETLKIVPFSEYFKEN